MKTERIDLTLDLMYGLAVHLGRNKSKYDAELFKLHPQEIMKILGITHTVAVPQSLFDCWQFWGCENIPDRLPEFLEAKNYGDPRADYKCLSVDQIDRIVAKYGEFNEN